MQESPDLDPGAGGTPLFLGYTGLHGFLASLS